MDNKHCPNCGKALTETALQGLCPECLMKAGWPTAPSADGQASDFTPPELSELAALFPQLEILEQIGKGGMGAVYKARQPELDRLVALKILIPKDPNDPGFAERFTREARALARLSHPNIVAVYDFGHIEELHYFIMEFVDGPNLRDIEKAGEMSPREALQIIPQICVALQFAHDEGIVHRDIKPENILLNRKGRVKIADFGLAKILGHEAHDLHLTLPGHVMGTPHYMAPEQVEHPQDVDHRADIYSLGVVFYEMLTGELPMGKFQPPSRKVQVDVRLDEVVLRTLAKEPELRYQQVSQVRTEVQTIASHPDENSQPLIKSSKCGVSTPQYHQTDKGRFTYVWQGKGELKLNSERLRFQSDWQVVTIPLASIERIAKGMFPKTLKPAPVYYMEITFKEYGESRTLLFTPYLHAVGFNLSHKSTVLVQEWLDALLDANQAHTGNRLTVEETHTVKSLPGDFQRSLGKMFGGMAFGFLIANAIAYLIAQSFQPSLWINTVLFTVMAIVFSWIGRWKRRHAYRFDVTSYDPIEHTASFQSNSANGQQQWLYPVLFMRGWWFNYEYRSPHKIWGLPLVHVAMGFNPKTGRPRVARGFIAIGNFSVGVVAIGGLALGAVTIAGLGMGMLCLAGASFGVVALGGSAVGLLAAAGGGALGTIALGAGAAGYRALGDSAIDLPLPFFYWFIPLMTLLLALSANLTIRRLNSERKGLWKPSIQSSLMIVLCITGIMLPILTSLDKYNTSKIIVTNTGTKMVEVGAKGTDRKVYLGKNGVSRFHRRAQVLIGNAMIRVGKRLEVTNQGSDIISIIPLNDPKPYTTQLGRGGTGYFSLSTPIQIGDMIINYGHPKTAQVIERPASSPSSIDFNDPNFWQAQIVKHLEGVRTLDCDLHIKTTHYKNPIETYDLQTVEKISLKWDRDHQWIDCKLEYSEERQLDLPTLNLVNWHSPLLHMVSGDNYAWISTQKNEWTKTTPQDGLKTMKSQQIIADSIHHLHEYGYQKHGGVLCSTSLYTGQVNSQINWQTIPWQHSIDVNGYHLLQYNHWNGSRQSFLTIKGEWEREAFKLLEYRRKVPATGQDIALEEFSNHVYTKGLWVPKHVIKRQLTTLTNQKEFVSEEFALTVQRIVVNEPMTAKQFDGFEPPIGDNITDQTITGNTSLSDTTFPQTQHYITYPLQNQEPKYIAEILNEIIQKTTGSRDEQGDKIIIIAEESTFSLIVCASDQNQKWIRSQIEQLDRARDQILIKSQQIVISNNSEFIASVNLISKASTIFITDALEKGSSAIEILELLRASTSVDSQAINPNTDKDFSFFNESQIQLLLKWISETQSGRVVATPFILLNDNGVGTICSNKSSYQSSNSPSLKTGIDLEIQPHISENNQIRMEISFDKYGLAHSHNKDFPDQTNSNITTVATIPNGHTIILGANLFIDSLASNSNDQSPQTQTYLLIQPKIIKLQTNTSEIPNQ